MGLQGIAFDFETKFKYLFLSRFEDFGHFWESVSDYLFRLPEKIIVSIDSPDTLCGPKVAVADMSQL
jgi:hypothetical protein